MEEQLDAVLFEQIGKKIYLTEDGKKLYEYADKIFNLVNEAKLTINDMTI